MRTPPAGGADLGGKAAAHHAGVGRKVKLKCAQGREVWCRARRYDCVRGGSHGSRTFGTEASYDGGVGPRLEDGGVSIAGGVAMLSQEQDQAFPSRSEHVSRSRRQAESLNRCVAASRYLSSVSDTDRVAAIRALLRVANELLLFL